MLKIIIHLTWCPHQSSLFIYWFRLLIIFCKLSIFLYILPDPLSSIIGRCTLYTPVCRMKAYIQVTISKLSFGSLICTRGESPCTGDIQLTSRSEGRCTYLVSSLQITLRKACSDTEIFLAASGDRTWDL